MTDVEEPQLNTLAERIAALNRQKNFQAPTSGSGKRPPPPPPPVSRSARTQHTVSQASPVEQSHATQGPNLPARPVRTVNNAPPLPQRTTSSSGETPAGRATLPPPLPTRTSQQLSPGLPPRRPSSQMLRTRRDSGSSDVSHLSAISSASMTRSLSSATSCGTEMQPTRKLPPAFGETTLPPLPPTRREREAKAKGEAAARASLAQTKSAPAVPRIAILDPPRPSLPPPLPSRPARSPGIEKEEPSPPLPTRRLPPPPKIRDNGHVPPPVPVASRPSFSQVDAVVTRASPTSRPVSAPPRLNCLVCRDFSGPDDMAAQHPTHTLHRQDPVGHLARVLCEPFQSHTDKARAIFTWCHHNMKYDVEGFFGGCIPRGQTASEMIFSGKAVCEGYAKVYEAVARRAGLECVVVTGHGKGFGFVPVAEGQPPPPRKPTGHAWNAVRIDGGVWKLIDPCWGAGHIGAGNTYTQKFSPTQFYMSNEDFGRRHFPSDSRHFYRSDGRSPTWEEYVTGGLSGAPATWCGDASQEGLNEYNFLPAAKNIRVRGSGRETMRFQFAKVCEHWQAEVNGRGKQMLFVLCVHGADGQHDDVYPLETDGFWFWIDFPTCDLGQPGQTLHVMGINTMGEQDARGLTKEQFLQKKGRVGYSMVGMVSWELV